MVSNIDRDMLTKNYAINERISELESCACNNKACKISQFDTIYDILLRITAGDNVTVKKNKISNDAMYVSIAGKNISFTIPHAIFVISKYVSNFEIYSQLDGTVNINFTFYGLIL